jgi:L-ascorbate metabolism protein UlaG (beta-lactamase superfamily)
VARKECIVLTWLGQAGFRIEIGETCIVVDPWVSAHELRLVDAPPDALAAEGVDWLLVTHEHVDHLDLPLLPVVLERSPSVRVVLPAPIAPLVEGVVPESQLLLVEPGDTLDLGRVVAHVVPAFHGVTMDDAYGDGSALGGRPRFVGYVIDGRRGVYHAGDSIVTDALEAALAPLEIDVALLPINGRDAEREARGIVGNMNAREAAALAVEIGATLFVPYHWDGVAGNVVDPVSAVDAAEGRIEVAVPDRFRPLELG